MNKKKIIKVALIIAFLFIILQILNFLSGQKNDIQFNNDYSNIQKETNGTIKSDKSAVSGKKVSEKEIKKVGNIINQFVDFCNDKEIEKAYDLLSIQCKEVLYNSIDSFKEGYYGKLFNGEKRTYTVQNWTSDTYMVKFTEDLLSTGRTISETSYTDYITIINENGEKKLNINNLIWKKEINKEKQKDNIYTRVLSEIQYMEYSIYELEVTNNNNDIIELRQPSAEKKGIYLKDSKDTKHYAYINELTEDDLIIPSKLTKKVRIKFDNPYISGRKIKNLCFSNVVVYFSIEYRTARIIDFNILL